MQMVLHFANATQSFGHYKRVHFTRHVSVMRTERLAAISCDASHLAKCEHRNRQTVVCSFATCRFVSPLR